MSSTARGRWISILRIAGCLLGLLALALLGTKTLRQGGIRMLRNSGTLTEFETAMNNALPKKMTILAPYRWVNRLLGRRYFAERMIYLDDAGNILQGSRTQSVEPALTNVRALYQYCQESGRRFLYVIFPGKPCTDEEFRSLGIGCFRNAVADEMKAGLLEAGIPCLDTRPLFAEDFYSMFYRTDHHWTAEAGLRAAGAMLEALNRECGYAFEVERLALDRFDLQRLPHFWYGELGRKTLGPYGVWDDFVLVTPREPVRLTYRDWDAQIERTGDFEILTDPDALGAGENTGTTSYYYYLSGNTIKELENADLTEGNLLIIKDSFANMVLPYLTLAVKHITAWDMRKDKEILSWLETHPEIETVLIAYNVSFMPNSGVNDFR